MRNFFQKIPFIRITSLFLIGILLNHFLKIELHLAAILITLLISLSILLWRNSNFTSIKAQNFLISITIILSGVFYPTRRHQNSQQNFSQKEYFLAEVCQKPVSKAKTYQTILNIQNTIHERPEKVIAYISKTQFDSTISTGDQLILLAKPQIIKTMGNPFEFDYQAMMQRKEIWYSVYLSAGTYLKTGHKVYRISYFAERLRDKLISKLLVTSLKNQELAVVEALTLGYRSELDPDTIDYFASTGAMHVLAVSGLHVGLIYFILGFLLSGIKRYKIGKFIFPAVMIVSLWIYAFITGFSPSVQRATVMITFIILGSILRRPVNVYNTLTSSALVLILLDPEVILEVGFQLSYLAVFGIVLVQPILAGLV
jgi:competence protein ComEC